VNTSATITTTTQQWMKFGFGVTGGIGTEIGDLCYLNNTYQVTSATNGNTGIYCWSGILANNAVSPNNFITLAIKFYFTPTTNVMKIQFVNIDATRIA
jgi:hypothetical protein